jgi:hypothetical protein
LEIRSESPEQTRRQQKSGFAVLDHGHGDRYCLRARVHMEIASLCRLAKVFFSAKQESVIQSNGIPCE